MTFSVWQYFAKFVILLELLVYFFCIKLTWYFDSINDILVNYFGVLMLDFYVWIYYQWLLDEQWITRLAVRQTHDGEEMKS